MKKLLFLPLVLIASFCFAQDAKEIIGKPVKIGNLLVAENDFPEYLNFQDAKKACRTLGKGWRLPSQIESNILYKRRIKIENVSEFDYYWNLSGKVFPLCECAGPSDDMNDKSYKHSVRAVKSSF
jgi:hypothetical protein